MAKKKCGICGKELGFWDNKMPLKDGVICYPCLFNKGNFYGGADQRHMNGFLNSHTAAEIKELMDNPVKLEIIKRKVAPVNHHHCKPIAQCALCGQDIYKDDAPLEFKDSAYICLDCAAKYRATKAYNWASEHTIENFKESINQKIDFNDINFKNAHNAHKELKEIEQEKAKKKCNICGKELGFWSIEHPIKDGIICDSCFEKGSFYKDTDPKKIRKFLQTKTAIEIQKLINNPEELQNIKKKVAPKKHSFPPITKCALCGQDIYRSDAYLKLKDSSYICANCKKKYNFTSISKSIDWASEHTIDDLKEYLDQGKDFSDIELEIEQQRQKRSAEKEQEKAKKQAEKEKRKQEQAAIKAESVCYGAYYFNIKKRKIYSNTVFHGIEFFVNADEIVSYRVNEKGHDKNKHHVFTRAAVGAIIAGPAGAVIAGTTGGKINEYIDELGVIINLADGSNFEVSLLNAKNNKADGFFVRHAYSELNHVIAILDGWKATKKAVEDTKDNTDAPAEIRRYKQLMDDGIITQEEFEAKKKQLLGL
ncbi:DUF4428 domain-containing protein [Lactobacillus sp. ESL0230]|uniref:DUF4428 domain-containing protein n=1 Tax=Lactobacillus sp. ESL0230 TaxID=2069353 RepID=UPI000EFC7494|nr:DUF4428 domain-containing protein [Lactobacillus sp. ESL0230]RMC46827.1 DUF4428 domain-containing protein [Lactobacillus sp. ESL0230]